MADSQQDYHYYQQRPTHDVTRRIFPERVPSSSQVLAFAIFVPLGASLLILSGLTLTGTVMGLAVATPLFLIFSPVLVPAVLVIGLAVTGFLTSGALGVTALSAFAWMANHVRRSRLPEQLEHAKRRAQEAAGHVAKRSREAGEAVLSKAQESGQTARDEGRTSS